MQLGHIHIKVRNLKSSINFYKKRFAEKYRQLQSMEINPFTVDHRISWAMYFDDPDGNGLEIYVDTREDMGSSKEWLGKDRHLSEKQILEALNIK